MVTRYKCFAIRSPGGRAGDEAKERGMRRGRQERGRAQAVGQLLVVEGRSRGEVRR